jgi:hypothetical protein
MFFVCVNENVAFLSYTSSIAPPPPTVRGWSTKDDLAEGGARAAAFAL